LSAQLAARAAPIASRPFPPESQVNLSPWARACLDREVRGTYPQEACGFLLGRHEEPGLSIECIASVPNTSGAAGRSFAIDPLVLLELEDLAADHGLFVLGLYHSHPDSPALPSPSDHRFARSWPGWLWLIVSVGPAGTAEWTGWGSSPGGLQRISLDRG
jgi:proteasome lid subunit RPN8/RPN11